MEVELEDGPDEITLSAQELTQILMNLLMNASDACGHVGHVQITSVGEAERIVLTVDDDGPGVPDELREQVFEPFMTTKDVGKGTGLGLSVTRGLVEAAGGSIGLGRSPTGGARFELIFPRRPA